MTTLDSENDEHSHRWPDILPGGKAVLYTTRSRREDETIYRNIDVVSLETGERKALIEGGIYGRYLPTGHIAYVWEGTLLAVPFDLGQLEVTGTPLPLLDNVSMNTGRGSAQVGFSQTETLVYLTRGSATDAESIFWMDREGKIDPLLSTPRDYSRLRFSPDGRRLAVNFSDGKNRDIWVYDLEREALSRLTFHEGTDRAPVWTPDGRYVTFRSAREGGAGNIYWKRADGTGDAERLTEGSNLQVPNSWSPDGKVLAFFEQSTETGWDLWTLPMEKDGVGDLKPGKPVSFLLTPFNEMWPAFSPDGRWIAHNSSESGTYEVYVRPFPGPGGQVADFDNRRIDADLVSERKRTLLPDHRKQNYGGHLFGRGRLLPGRKTSSVVGGAIYRPRSQPELRPPS